MSDDCTHTALWAVSGLALYLIVDSVSKRMKWLVSGNGYFVAGSPYVQAYSLPLMVLDTLVVATLVAVSLYAAFTTDVTRYPMLYPDSRRPHWSVECVVAVNVGRYASKLVIAVQNRPTATITHPAVVCVLYSAFMAVSLQYHMFLGFCLIGVLSESSKMLKWLQYLPHDATFKAWYSALLVIRYFVTFLVKGVFAIALTILAFLVQMQYFLDNVHMGYAVLSLMLAGCVMLTNFGHMVVFTTYVLEHFRGKQLRYSGGITQHILRRRNAPIVRSGLNDTSTPPTTKTGNLQFVKNQFRGDADVQISKPFKEKNCNLAVDKQYCVVVNEKAIINSEKEKVPPKTNRTLPGRPVPRPISPMSTIDEE